MELYSIFSYSKFFFQQFSAPFLWTNIHTICLFWPFLVDQYTYNLFVLTVGYVNMTTYPLTKYYYIIDRVYFIYRLSYYLSVHCHFCCFYIQYHGRIREINFMPIFCFIIFSVLLTRWRNIKLHYTTFVLAKQKRSRYEHAHLPPPPHPQSTICSYAPGEVFLIFQNLSIQ